MGLYFNERIESFDRPKLFPTLRIEGCIVKFVNNYEVGLIGKLFVMRNDQSGTYPESLRQMTFQEVPHKIFSMFPC